MRAVIHAQLGSVPVDKQTLVCLQICLIHHFNLVAIVPPWRPQDAVAMIRRQFADIVLVAYGGGFLAEDVEAAGGKVYAAHPELHVVRPSRGLRTATDIIRRLRMRGRSAHEIADLLGEDTSDITEMIRRLRG